MERFWKLEELSMKEAYSPDERRCESFYKETTQRVLYFNVYFCCIEHQQRDSRSLTAL